MTDGCSPQRGKSDTEAANEDTEEQEAGTVKPLPGGASTSQMISKKHVPPKGQNHSCSSKRVENYTAKCKDDTKN